MFKYLLLLLGRAVSKKLFFGCHLLASLVTKGEG